MPTQLQLFIFTVFKFCFVFSRAFRFVSSFVKSFHFSNVSIESIDWQLQKAPNGWIVVHFLLDFLTSIHCVPIQTRNDSTTTTTWSATPCLWPVWSRKSFDFTWGFLKRKIPKFGIERNYSACVRICMWSRRLKIYTIEIGRSHRAAQIFHFCRNAAAFVNADDRPIRKLYCAKIHRNRQWPATPMDSGSRWITFDDTGLTQIRMPCRSTGHRICRDELQWRAYPFATILWTKHRCVGSGWTRKSCDSIFVPFGVGSDSGKSILYTKKKLCAA